MNQIKYRNHNSVYYPWVRNRVRGCRRILDAGCGNGLLADMLREEGRIIVGIDPSAECISAAEQYVPDPAVRFINCTFDYFSAEKESFDAVIFSASLHHMDMASAIRKAKELLADDGVLVIIGLASPSGIGDYLLDLARVVPAYIGTHMHHMKTSEEMNIPVSYDLMKMDEVRNILKQEMPGVRIRYGLYWRYLAYWKKGESR